MKNTRRFFSAALATTMVVGAAASSFAAMPGGSLVMGDKAYNLSYAFAAQNEDEINDAFLANGGTFYYKEFGTGEWFDALGNAATAASVPAVTYKNADGTTVKYEAADGNVVVEGQPAMKLTPSKPEIIVNPGGVSDPVEITLELLEFPEDIEATVEFNSTWGQISKVETTQGGKVVVKLYPEEDSEDKTAQITATLVNAKNIKTGEIFEDYVNTVKPVETSVLFKVKDSGDEAKVFKVNQALTDQADRVFVNLNNELNDDARKVILKHPEYFKVYDNTKEFAKTKPVKVLAVQEKDADTLVLVLDTADANFPLTDNVKHRVEVEGKEGDIYIDGNADFFLEDSTYIKLMRVESKANDTQAGTEKALKSNQIRATFSEAVNAAKLGEPGYANSSINLQNWVIRGLNLATDRPSLANAAYDHSKDIAVEIQSIKTSTTEREAVVITFNRAEDVKEFLLDQVATVRKLQVNTLGDWASVTDTVNIVATQELEYPAIPSEKVALDWYEDGDKAKDADGMNESPEQFICEFNDLVTNAAGTFDLTDNFRIILPDQTKVSPYVNNFDVLTEANGDFTVTTLVPGKKYMIEVDEDWTKYYDTEGTLNNYHINRVNPIRLEAVNLRNMLGEQIKDDGRADVVLTAKSDLTLVEDTQSPFTVEKTQITFKKGEVEKIADRYVYADQVTVGAGAVYIAMNEPVQFVDQNGSHNVTPINLENSLTPSQQQDKTTGVPVNTFEYVMLKDAQGKAVMQNITVEGKIVSLQKGPNAEEPNRDYAVIVEPIKELTDGEWKLVIRSISDDVGNTMKTEEMPIVVSGKTSTLKLIAVDAHHTVVNDDDNAPVDYNGHDWLPSFGFAKDDENVNDAADVMHVVFNKNMILTGDTSVLNKANYRLNGEPLPVDGTQIVRGIKGAYNGTLENAQNAVTIILPDGYLQERDYDHTLTVINVDEATKTDTAVNERVQVPYLTMHDVTSDPLADGVTGDVLPAATTEVKAGLTAFDRLVEVKLATDKDTDYKVTVTVGGTTYTLDYIAGADVFRKVVASTDEAAIKAAVKVEKIVAPTMPTATTEVKAGLTAFDRLVEVKLDTTDDANYNVTVEVGGKSYVLNYIASADVFRAVVTSTDEAAIKAGVKVAAK